MATSTVHPNHQLISSEDVEGANVYDMKGTKIGDIDQAAANRPAAERSRSARKAASTRRAQGINGHA